MLQAYIGSYTSHTKVDRLLFIADHYQGKPLELEALKLAADEVKQVRIHWWAAATAEQLGGLMRKLEPTAGQVWGSGGSCVRSAVHMPRQNTTPHVPQQRLPSRMPARS